MQIRTPIELGAAIRHQRELRGIDQQTLAMQIGVTRQWLIAVEKGKARAEVGLILRALDELGLVLSLESVENKPRGGGQLDIDAVVERARRSKT